MYGNKNKTLKPIYGMPKKCSAPDPNLDVNTYIASLNQVLNALNTHYNKPAALENIKIVETRIQTAVYQSLGLPLPPPQ
jgi:hypothetical protein